MTAKQAQKASTKVTDARYKHRKQAAVKYFDEVLEDINKQIGTAVTSGFESISYALDHWDCKWALYDLLKSALRKEGYDISFKHYLKYDDQVVDIDTMSILISWEK